jgi:hypothetical protein
MERANLDELIAVEWCILKQLEEDASSTDTSSLAVLLTSKK